MEQIRHIINQIQYASAKELGRLLEGFNREAYQEYDWNTVSVRASYSDIIPMIEDAWRQCKMYLDYGNETMEVEDCQTGEKRTLSVRQALTNLRLSKEFFENPPIVENPNVEGVSVPTDGVVWDKPVYTSDEIKKLLGLSDSTFRRWLNGGWIPYTQMEGSDKKFITKEGLLEFLNNPKIFYPSTK